MQLLWECVSSDQFVSPWIAHTTEHTQQATEAARSRVGRDKPSAHTLVCVPRAKAAASAARCATSPRTASTANPTLTQNTTHWRAPQMCVRTW